MNVYSQSLESASYAVKKDLTASKQKLKHLKRKAIVKSVVTTVFLVGGVATGILLPNPISMAVILGCTTVLSGSEGIKHTIKRFKTTKVDKRRIQAVDKETDDQMLVDKLRVLASQAPQASAPDLYPTLRV